jgi:GDP/UDP-N,N'-diacetylbacillosamine 2-epimerase (hydrolysing)
MIKIAVITTSRSDYGILSPLLRKIDTSDLLNLELIVSGSHLSENLGYTLDEIRKDGFNNYHLVDIDIDMNNEKYKEADIISVGLNKFSQLFKATEPNIVVVLGDRYELFSAVLSAFFLKITLAHIHGGEKTVGALDDSIRHAITKLSHIHFPATEIYKKRIIQLGENENNVFNVGSLSVENIKNTKFLDRNEIFKRLGLDSTRKLLLVTYHPTTLGKHNANEEIELLLHSLKQFKFANILLTGSNADTGGIEINKKIQEYTKQRNNWFFNISLGQKLFLNILKYCDVFIGNSSSGIIEAPSFKVPVVNIGNRQEGRVFAENIISVPLKKSLIVETIQNILNNGLELPKKFKNPHDGSITSNKIVEILSLPGTATIKTKNFVDLSFKI